MNNGTHGNSPHVKGSFASLLFSFTSSFFFSKYFFLLFVFSYIFLNGNQKVKSIIVTEVTIMRSFIMYSSQNPWNFLDMEVIMIKDDDKCLSPFQLKSIRVTFLQ